MTKVAELFAEIKLDMSKLTEQLTSAESKTRRAAGGIISQIEAIKKVSDFRIRLNQLSGVEEAQRALEGVVGKIISLKDQMALLSKTKTNLLYAAGVPMDVADKFGARSGLPPGFDNKSPAMADLRSIDSRRAAITSEMVQLLNMRAMAESKLTAEQARQTAATQRQNAEDMVREAIIRRDEATQARRAKVMSFVAGVIDMTTTAQERQIQFLERLNHAYHNGYISAAQFARAQKMAADIRMFERGGAMSSGLNRFHFAIQQLSFGFQDFLTVFGTMGLRGGLQAATNNFAQFAAILSPGVGGAIAGLAITIGSVLIPQLLNIKDRSQEAKEAMDGLRESLERLSTNRKVLAEIEEAHRGTGIETMDDALSEITKRSQKVNDLKKAAERAQEELNNLQEKGGFVGIAEIEGVKGEIKLAQMPHMPGAMMAAKVLQKRAEEMGGTGYVIEKGKAYAVREVTDEERKVRAEARKKVEQELADIANKTTVAEEELAAARRKLPETAQKEIKNIEKRERLTQMYMEGESEMGPSVGIKFSRERAEKLADIEMDRAKQWSEIFDLFQEGKINKDEFYTAQDLIFSRSERKEMPIAEEQQDEWYAKFDKSNEQYSKRKEEREKRAAKLEQQLGNENLSDRARRIAEISQKLEERRKEIYGATAEGSEERARLLGLAAASAQKEMGEVLRPKGGGELVGAAQFQQVVQKSLMGDSVEQNTKQAAMELKTQTKHLETQVATLKAIQAEIGNARAG